MSLKNENFQFFNCLPLFSFDYLEQEFESTSLSYSTPFSLESQKPNCITEFKRKENETIFETIFNEIKNSFKEGGPDLIILDHINPLLLKGKNGVFELISSLKTLNKTILILIHDDIEKEKEFFNYLEYFSDLVFTVKGLPSGYSKDVHGSLEFQDKILHFKNFEQNVKLFPRGFGDK
jgi:hypothetical protein